MLIASIRRRRIARRHHLRPDHLPGRLLHPQDYELLRRIRFKDPESGKTLVFITNNFSLPAATICALYKSRWQVELLQVDRQRSSDQALRPSENAVKTQIWIAVSVYVLVAIVKKRLDLDASLYTLLQILSVTLFVERCPYIKHLRETKTDATLRK